MAAIYNSSFDMLVKCFIVGFVGFVASPASFHYHRIGAGTSATKDLQFIVGTVFFSWLGLSPKISLLECIK